MLTVITMYGLLLFSMCCIVWAIIDADKLDMYVEQFKRG